MYVCICVYTYIYIYIYIYTYGEGFTWFDRALIWLHRGLEGFAGHIWLDEVYEALYAFTGPLKGSFWRLRIPLWVGLRVV